MSIKKFGEYDLNENLGYKDFFGKDVSHDKALQKSIRDCIIQIVIDANSISEKSFRKYDQVINDVKELCDNNPEIYETAQVYYETGKRLNLLAEESYDKYYNKKGN